MSRNDFTANEFTTRQRRLQDGDFMHIEYGAAYRRYCTTIDRQFCMGEPSARMPDSDCYIISDDAESDYGVFIAPRIDIATEDNEPDPVLLFQKACFPRAA